MLGDTLENLASEAQDFSVTTPKQCHKRLKMVHSMR